MATREEDKSKSKRCYDLLNELTALAKAGREMPADKVEEIKTLVPARIYETLFEHQRHARGRIMISNILSHGLNRHKDAISPEAALLGLIAAKLYHLEDELAELFPWAVPTE